MGRIPGDDHRGEQLIERLPRTALLSQALVAFTIEFDNWLLG
jgi:hypothetical protein